MKVTIAYIHTPVLESNMVARAVWCIILEMCYVMHNHSCVMRLCLYLVLRTKKYDQNCPNLMINGNSYSIMNGSGLNSLIRIALIS